MTPSHRFNLWIAAGAAAGLITAACGPAESSGECATGRPCENRGEVCDVTLSECIPQDLDVDATATPTPANFTGVALPFFRGKVCVAKGGVKPGETVPVKFSPCLHPCITGGGYKFKKQYRCTGSSCEAASLQYYGTASGTGCPKDAFGRFDKSMCVYTDIKASAGPFVIPTGPVTGVATIEVPFLTNEDAAKIRDGATTDQIWELIYKYPQDPNRVFHLTLNAGNASPPADCSDESKCDCREIGF